MCHRNPRLQFKTLEWDDGDPLPPEKYVFSFTCNHIRGVGKTRRPIIGKKIDVLVHLVPAYPGVKPLVIVLAPHRLWHPNVSHSSGEFCTGKWLNQPLDQFVAFLGRMIVWAVYDPGDPKSKKVARWAREVGEKRGYVGPNRPTDSDNFWPKRRRAASIKISRRIG